MCVLASALLLCAFEFVVVLSLCVMLLCDPFVVLVLVLCWCVSYVLRGTLYVVCVARSVICGMQCVICVLCLCYFGFVLCWFVWLGVVCGGVECELM